MEENRDELTLNEEETMKQTDLDHVTEEESAPEESLAREENGALDERAEYERLVKTRFKELYAEDTQKMINRRFRKYKVLEEKYRVLEELLTEKEAKLSENAQKIADFDEILRTELEKAVKETEERITREIRTRRARPEENGISPRSAQAAPDVSGLTKKQRAELARRAANGEKIRF